MNAQAQILKPAADVISAFLYMLFAPDFVRAYPDAWIEIVCIRPDKTIAWQFFSAHDIPPIVKYVVNMNCRGYNCYVGAALRHGERPKEGRAGKAHFYVASHVWIDIDDTGGYERARAICRRDHLKPDMVHTTGTAPHTRIQIWIKLDQPIAEIAKLEKTTTALRDLFDGDKVQNGDRIMRIPGAFNYPSPEKVNNGYAVELTTLHINATAPSYSAERLCALHRADPKSAASGAGKSDSAGGGQTDNHFDPFQRYADEQMREAGRLTDGDMRALLEKHQNGNGEGWHNDLLAVTWELLVRGYDPFGIQMIIGSACKKGFDDPDIGRLVNKRWDEFQAQRREADRSEAEERTVNASVQQKRSSIIATPYGWTAPEAIPPREFLYGRRLIRKYVTATIAPGGVGKTALEVTEVLSMVSGTALLGVQTPQMRVWLWSLEDPREEMARRIQATAKHYNLTAENIGDRLFLDSGREQPLVIAEMQRNGVVIYRPLVDALIAQLKARAIDVLIIDPSSVAIA
ncbi:AAA family ATPase [Bradyrhizobium sp. 186]|uniref:AAA family ATPase n=1 Tax=Bradyrhizobium sp. 186 TaxID=2782654 RepID=UPI002000FB3A|nr:AAA family ATPase [Bradyrhizobium sp. 186]UPK31758.1 AAA family ATPase [Bradyrhizobium sp. 186]